MPNKSGIHIKKSKQGSLHKALGVSKGEKIPASKLKIKSTDSPALKKKKQFALNAKKFHHQTGGDGGADNIPQYAHLPSLVSDSDILALNDQQNQQQQQGAYADSPAARQKMLQQQQQGKATHTGNNKWVKAFNIGARAVTGVENMIENEQRKKQEQLQLIQSMTPRYMQNMEGEGLNNPPAYTQYGGDPDNAPGHIGPGLKYLHPNWSLKQLAPSGVNPNKPKFITGIHKQEFQNPLEYPAPQRAILPGLAPINAGSSIVGTPDPSMPQLAISMYGGDDRQMTSMMYGGSDLGMPEDYSNMTNEDYGYQGIAHNGPYGQMSMYRAGGQVSAEKAKEILKDGTAQGHPLTDKQKRYFGWIAGGGKAQAGGGAVPPEMADAYYASNAELSYFKNKLNDKLKAKNPEAFGKYFKGLVDLRRSGKTQDAEQYTQGSDYNDYLSPEEVKKSLGDADYTRYNSALQRVNKFNIQQGKQPLYGTVEGDQDVSKLNYGRRFASLQVNPTYSSDVLDSAHQPIPGKKYSRAYEYDPGSGSIRIKESGDVKNRPAYFSQGDSVPEDVALGTAAPAGTKMYGGYRHMMKGGYGHTGGQYKNGGNALGIGDEVDLTPLQILAMKKQGYDFEDC